MLFFRKSYFKDNLEAFSNELLGEITSHNLYRVRFVSLYSDVHFLVLVFERLKSEGIIFSSYDKKSYLILKRIEKLLAEVVEIYSYFEREISEDNLKKNIPRFLSLLSDIFERYLFFCSNKRESKFESINEFFSALLEDSKIKFEFSMNSDDFEVFLGKHWKFRTFFSLFRDSRDGSEADINGINYNFKGIKDDEKILYVPAQEFVRFNQFLTGLRFNFFVSEKFSFKFDFPVLVFFKGPFLDIGKHFIYSNDSRKGWHTLIYSKLAEENEKKEYVRRHLSWNWSGNYNLSAKEIREFLVLGINAFIQNTATYVGEDFKQFNKIHYSRGDLESRRDIPLKRFCDVDHFWGLDMFNSNPSGARDEFMLKFDISNSYPLILNLEVETDNNIKKQTFLTDTEKEAYFANSKFSLPIKNICVEHINPVVGKNKGD